MAGGCPPPRRIPLPCRGQPPDISAKPASPHQLCCLLPWQLTLCFLSDGVTPIVGQPQGVPIPPPEFGPPPYEPPSQPGFVPPHMPTDSAGPYVPPGEYHEGLRDTQGGDRQGPPPRSRCAPGHGVTQCGVGADIWGLWCEAPWGEGAQCQQQGWPQVRTQGGGVAVEGEGSMAAGWAFP